jgi:hypothetical protein
MAVRNAVRSVAHDLMDAVDSAKHRYARLRAVQQRLTGVGVGEV